MSTFTANDLKPLIGNSDAEFIRFASGATAYTVTLLLRDTIGRMEHDDRKSLGTVFILSAFTTRRNISEMLMRPEMSIVNKYLIANWSMKNSYNFTNMNLAGNMIMAAHVNPGTPLIESFRARLKGLSIWHTDISTSGLSDTSKAIAKERVAKTSMSEAMNYGSAVIYLLAHGSGGFNGKVLPSDLSNFNATSFNAGMGATTVPGAESSRAQEFGGFATQEEYMADLIAKAKEAEHIIRAEEIRKAKETGVPIIESGEDNAETSASASGTSKISKATRMSKRKADEILRGRAKK